VPTEHSQNAVRTIWQQQPLEGGRMSVEQISQRAQQLDSRIRRNDLRRIFTAMAVIALATWGVWAFSNPFFRVGAALEIAAMLVVVYYLQTRRVGRRAHENLSYGSGQTFLRRSLELRRDFVREVWPWQILPTLPGIVLLAIGFFVRTPRNPLLATGILIVFVAQLALAQARVRRSVKHYQAEIDALEE
jgi:hypothetical protein